LVITLAIGRKPFQILATNAKATDKFQRPHIGDTKT
jgi:hypothetical protein